MRTVLKSLCTNKKAFKPDFHHYDDSGFKNLKLVDDAATIEGFIEDYDTTIFSSEGSLNYNCAFTSVSEEESTTRFTIQPDGRFRVKFRMFNPQPVWLSIEGSTQTRIFAEPGQTEFICFNKKLFDLAKDPGLWQKFDDWDVNHYMGSHGLLSEELILLDPFVNSLENSILESGMDDKLSQLEYQRWRTRVLFAANCVN